MDRRFARWSRAVSLASLHGSLLASTQHNIEAIAERRFRNGGIPIKHRNEALACLLIRGAVVDRIRREKWVAGKVHLRDQAGGERGTEEGEMNVGRAPCVVVIAPGIAARLHRDEAVMAIGVGQGVTTTGEVGIEWRIVLIDGV